MKTKIWFKTKNQVVKYTLKHFKSLKPTAKFDEVGIGFGVNIKHYYIEVEVKE